MQEPINREMENAIQVLREAGFEPEGKARLLHRFAKPAPNAKPRLEKSERAFTRCQRPENR